MCMNWSPQFSDVNGLFLDEEGMLHSGKHAAVLTFLRGVNAINCKNKVFFKTFIHFLCSVVNKMQVCEIFILLLLLLLLLLSLFCTMKSTPNVLLMY